MSTHRSNNGERLQALKRYISQLEQSSPRNRRLREYDDDDNDTQAMRMVVFDMAGTTVDEQNVVYKAVTKALNNGGYKVDLDTVLLHGAGKEKSVAIKDTIAALTRQPAPEAKVKKIFEDFKKILKVAYDVEPILPMPGAEELFAELRRKNIFVVLDTGYDRPTAEHLLRRLDWSVGREVDMLITASDVKLGRPHPEMIRKAMNRFGLTDPSQVMKVGDSGIDIEEGLNTGCGHSVGITTGAQTASQLQDSNPTAIVDSLDELRPLIFGCGSGRVSKRGGGFRRLSSNPPTQRLNQLQQFVTSERHDL